jgi:hypothetical protein
MEEQASGMGGVVWANDGDPPPSEATPVIAPAMTIGLSRFLSMSVSPSALQKARVINDLRGQVGQFKSKHGRPITIGIAGINRAAQYVSYEGDKEWPTTGVGRHKHPHQEADESEARLLSLAAPDFDEFLILRFTATNSPPFPFNWVDPRKTNLDYGAVLARVSSRF